ncbi:unnamed protein product [Notodromas monacha]|uniref:Tetratricopeptide repeat protein 17 n=1 Tax=Notodromas monacha TaxID=399045 RepID=A0A7R9BMS2_9CRUS|nr:unnamed protein product [Notodromas monacha]CAG0917503.1 unnamed protein product [Notodromas monacha]
MRFKLRGPLCGPVVLVLLCAILNLLWASTHWVLTDDGRVVAQVDSAFHLKRPHDFVTFMRQEQLVGAIASLEKNLLEEPVEGKKLVDGTEMNVEDEDVEARIFSTDPDCRATGSLFTEMDLYPSLVPYLWPFARSSDHSDIYIGSLFDGKLAEIKKLEPDCRQPRIMHVSTFDHLQGVQLSFRNPEALQIRTDEELSQALGPRYFPKINGSLAAARVHLNASDWDAYNWAAVYWRVVGNASESLECARKAVHYSPRSQKDVALNLMGMSLHYARLSDDALVVLEAALDHVLPLVEAQPKSEELRRRTQVSAVAVGVVAALVERYNRSAEAFDIASEYTQDKHSREASPIRDFPHAIRCYQKMERALKEQKDVLQKTLDDLKEQRVRYKTLLEYREVVLQEQATPESILESRLVYEEHRIRKNVDGKGHDCFQYHSQGQVFLSCNVRRKTFYIDGEEISAFVSDDSLTPTGIHSALDELEWLRANVDKNLKKQSDPSKRMLPILIEQPKAKNTVAEAFDAEFIKINHSEGDADVVAERRARMNLPIDTECSLYNGQPAPHWRDPVGVFALGQDKGFNLSTYFEDILLTNTEKDMPLPWMPPLCNEFKPDEKIPFSTVQSVSDLAKYTQLIEDIPELRKQLLALAGPSKSIYELGHRIEETMMIAENTRSRPVWPVYNAAGLYWRLEGKPNEAMVCFLRAFRAADEEDGPNTETHVIYRSVPVLNLAAVVHKLGNVDDAIKLLKYVHSVDPKNVAANVLLGKLLVGTGNWSGGIMHLREAVLMNPVDNEIWQSFVSTYCRYGNAVKLTAPPEETTNVGFTKASCSSFETKMSSCEELEPITVSFARIFSSCKPGENSPLCDAQQPPRITGKSFENSVDWLRMPCRLLNDESSRETILCALVDPKLPQHPCGVAISCFAAAKKPNGEWDFGAMPGQLGSLFSSSSKLQACSVAHSPKILREISAAHNLWTKRGNLQFAAVGPVPTPMLKQIIADEVQGYDDPEDASLESLDQCETVETSDFLDDAVPELLLSRPAMARLRGEKEPLPRVALNPLDCDTPAMQIDHPKSMLHGQNAFVSTWLSARDKEIDFKDHIPRPEEIVDASPEHPTCDPDFLVSMLTLDHLSGVRHRNLLKQPQELGLSEALLNIGAANGESSQESAWIENYSSNNRGVEAEVSSVGRRIAAALHKDPHSWIVTTIASLYWRVVGDAPKAVNCLRISLHHAPWRFRDMPLISLANVLHRSNLHNDSLIVANMALGVSPSSVPIHFTMANIYVQMKAYNLAFDFYKSSWALQKSLDVAQERMKAILCHQFRDENLSDEAVLIAPGR